MEPITPNELFAELKQQQLRRQQLEDELEMTDFTIEFIESLIKKLN